jgi:hypothetical protein
MRRENLRHLLMLSGLAVKVGTRTYQCVCNLLVSFCRRHILGPSVDNRRIPVQCPPLPRLISAAARLTWS